MVFAVVVVLDPSPKTARALACQQLHETVERMALQVERVSLYIDTSLGRSTPVLSWQVHNDIDIHSYIYIYICTHIYTCICSWEGEEGLCF